MIKGVFSLLLCCGGSINQDCGQKTWLMFGYYLSAVALETLYCHSVFIFIRSEHFPSEMIPLVFCSVQYKQKNTFLNTRQKGRLPIGPSPPNQLFVTLFKTYKIIMDLGVIIMGWDK